ncbi:hypothetical protein [Staphylococcus felis]|uniref:hypothetical protein n=1 Tax=Staphylococcus felis TaxID=46127 RepID=UPI0015F25B10|nr:hypothetical protein [Staphylococcus felis]
MVRESKITKLYIMHCLNCNKVYANKMIEVYKDDHQGLEDELKRQIMKRQTLPAIIIV